MSYRPDSRWGDDLASDYRSLCSEESREERRQALNRDRYQQYLDRAFDRIGDLPLKSFGDWLKGQ